MHVVAPKPSWNCPSAHCPHAALPLALENLPGAQREQFHASVLGWDRPGAHAMQSREPMDCWDLPEGQGAQNSAFSAPENFPLAQSWHALSLSAVAFVLMNFPCAHVATALHAVAPLAS